MPPTVPPGPHTKGLPAVYNDRPVLFRHLMVASDPLLSSLGLQRRRRLYCSRQGPLRAEVLALLAESELYEAPVETEEVADGSPETGE